MKKVLLGLIVVLAFSTESFAQAWEYKVITSIESIVPMGIGRSRIIENEQEMNYESFTSHRTAETNEKNKSKRSEAKVDNLAETKLLNFYSGVGINMQNVASNDAIITDRLNKLSAEGWELFQVVSGVESDAGKNDGKGIFITRYIFKKKKA